MFSFDRLSPRQRRVRTLLLPSVAVGAVAFVLLVPLLGHLLGGVWGADVMLLTLGIPIGMLWWVSEAGASWRVAAWRGIALALAAAFAYAWAFA
ncbi:MAG: hypothetical protein ABIT38_23585 [Gemmatimonadaceae bacterium]